MPVTPFATVEDYEARYGPVEDESRVSTLLGDAFAFVSSYPGFALDPESDTQAANLVRVTCAVVHRALSAGDLAGLSSYSEGAVGYSATAQVANPTEDLYLTTQERRSLGIVGGRVGTIRPDVHPWAAVMGE